MTRRGKPAGRPHKPRVRRPGEWASDGRGDFALWGLLALALLLGSGGHGWNEPVRVLAPAADAVLAPEWAWSVPLARIPAFKSIAEWPFWLSALCGAGLIGYVSSWIAREQAKWAAALALLGWSLSFESRHLPTAAILLGIARAIGRPTKAGRPRVAVGVLGAGIAGGVLISLDFGLIALAGSLLHLPRIWHAARDAQCVRSTVGLFLGFCGMLVLSAILDRGFAAALMRPMSWIWIQAHPELLPSLSSAFSREEHRAAFLLLMLYLACAWTGAFRLGKYGAPAVPALLFLSLIGLGCSRYLWLCSYALGTTPSKWRMAESADRLGRLAVAACLLIATVNLAVRYFPAVGSPADARALVDPAGWETRGPVLLMNLDHSGDWQTRETRRRFRLLVDDRWDIFADSYPTYASVCRDISSVRRETYFRTDGNWGGYSRRLEAWSPALVVIDSADLATLRRLSLSRDFSIMGLDARRTIVARREFAANAPQIQRALRVLLGLEWPGRSAAAPISRVLAA